MNNYKLCNKFCILESDEIIITYVNPDIDLIQREIHLLDKRIIGLANDDDNNTEFFEDVDLVCINNNWSANEYKNYIQNLLPHVKEFIQCEIVYKRYKEKIRRTQSTI
jgi:hypothetical protein